MSNVIERPQQNGVAVQAKGLTTEQKDLIRKTICKGASDDELRLFLAQCDRTGLDPFAKQIYCIKRRAQDDSGNWVDKMETQVGIDGFRLVAERTERYAPGREPTFKYDDKGHLVSATAYVKKLVAGTWHEVAATALYAEYVQTKKDGNPTRFWQRMPHGQLSKCAESLALRRAFPMELSGLYTAEEMEQGEVVDAEYEPADKKQHSSEEVFNDYVAHLKGNVKDANALKAVMGHIKQDAPNLKKEQLDTLREMCEKLKASFATTNGASHSKPDQRQLARDLARQLEYSDADWQELLSSKDVTDFDLAPEPVVGGIVAKLKEEATQFVSATIRK